MLEQIKDNWEEIVTSLKVDQALSDISFETWIEPLEPVSMAGNVLYVLFPGEKFGLDYIQQKKYIQANRKTGAILFHG